MHINIYFCLAMVVILMVCLLRSLFLYEKLHSRFDNLMESCNQMQKLNSELRAQRHDYLNHMQVVYGMVELEEYEELRGYLEPLYKDIMKTGKAIRTSIPAVNALLMAKMGAVETLGIDFYIEVKSDLKYLKIEPWELCKVLSNLIDNAITALSTMESDRKMILEIQEDRENYLFLVANNGPMIPLEMQNTIFKEGFTTKKEKGHGMGLSIVMTTLKKNKGSIQLTSNEKETVFTVRIKKEVKVDGNA